MICFFPLLSRIFLAVLLVLTGGGVSGFSPLLARQHHLATSHLGATVGLANLDPDPTVFFQRRIVEPKNVESVPSSLFLIGTEFPEEPFVVKYGSSSDYLKASDDKGPVLDLSVLKQIEVDDDGEWIKVDAGVTVKMLAGALSELENSSKFRGLKDLFLGLPANSLLSLVEVALDKRFDKFHKDIRELHVVDKDGNISSKQLNDINEQEDIIINIVLSPESQSKDSDDDEVFARWYTHIPTERPIEKGFVSDLPDYVKVMVFKYGMFNPVPAFVVFVDGDQDIGLSKETWEKVVIRTPEEYWRMQNELSIAACFDVLTASAVLDTKTSDIDPSFAQILDAFQNRKEQLLVTIEKGKIRASFDAKYPPDVDDATSKLFTFEDENVAPRMIAPAAVREKPRLSFRTAALLVKALVKKPNIIRGTVIEGFKGEIFDGTRGQMQDKRFQYATSSYDNMMNPSLIAYPLDEEDVALAIRYATLPEFANARRTAAHPSGLPFKVMGRGGGHQYCGVSCDNGAFILSMDKFEKLEMDNVTLENVTGPDGKPHTVTKEVHVGTGIKLKQWAEFAKDNGFTIPHGECPTVGIGGHSQTGGYGHIVRNFGLAIDYIYGFTIVTTNGDIRTVNRDSTAKEDKELYWAVMGGSPGAFGITTELIIHPILDKDYPHSTGYSATALYTKNNMQEVLAILEDFINRAHESDDNALAEGLDLMVTLSSKFDNGFFSWLPRFLSPSIILFELECRDKNDAKAYGQMQDIKEKFNNNVNRKLLKGNPFDGKTHYPLSEMSLGYTRSPPSVTNGGRENRRPYRKACYGSNDKLKPGWSQSYANLLHDVVNTKDSVHCIFQVVVGGGAQTRLGKANLNSAAHRDAQLHGIVFDLFRGEDDESIKAADEFGKRFEIDIVNAFQTAYPKVMTQWASHGDLDMNKKQVWEKYFDKPETYHKLRQIKKAVDPDDIFHSRFTLRPADD